MTTALFPMRVDRRRLLQLGGAGIATVPLLVRPGAAKAMRQAATTLNVANEAEPADLSPWMSGYAQALVTRQIYQPLVEVRMTLAEGSDSQAEIEYVPVLAESWQRVDDLTWRFALRQGVTFHNGEAFDAAAVKASYDVLADAELAAELGKFAMLSRTSGCTVVDDATVEITTAEPNAEMLGIVLRIGLVALPPAMLAEQGLAAFDENPVGTGPYRFVAWTRGQAIELARNEAYWDPDVTIFDTARIVTRPEATVRAQTISSGESDLAYNIGAEQAANLPRSATGGGFQSSSIRLNNAIAPTNDQRVRLAINHAIDRQAIVDSIFLGQAKPAAFFGFQPVSVEPYPYDPERARQLITEAGVEGAELELVYGEGRIPEEDQLAEIYKAYLDEIGLVIQLTKLEPAQYNELGGRPFSEQPPLYMETTSSGNYGEIAGGLADKYGSEGTGTFSDPAFDERFAQLASLEGEERVIELQAIADELHALAPRCWVAIVQQVHGVSEKLSPDLPLNAFLFFEDLAS